MDFTGFDFEAIGTDVREFARERPVEAVLFAFAAGFGLAVFASGRLATPLLRTASAAAIPASLKWLSRNVRGLKGDPAAPGRESTAPPLVH